MLRAWVVAAIWFVASTAFAEGIVVADSATAPAAVRSLVDLLGPDARVVPETPWSSVDDVLAWSESTGATIGIVIAIDQRRVYVAMPEAHRVIERVLPDDVTVVDSYAIAIAASELVELARWGDEATLAAAAAVSIPAHTEAPESHAEPADPREPVDPAEPPDAERTVLVAGHRFVVSLALGLGSALGLDRSFSLLDAELRLDVRLLREFAPGASLFFGGGIRGALPRSSRTSVGSGIVELGYTRTELDLRAGVAVIRGAWAFRPSLRFALAWVHVAATFQDVAAPAVQASDDRAAFAVGAGADVRRTVRARGFVGVDVGVDVLGARAPYVAFAERVLQEPVLRANLLIFGGIAFDP